MAIEIEVVEDVRMTADEQAREQVRADLAKYWAGVDTAAFEQWAADEDNRERRQMEEEAEQDASLAGQSSPFPDAMLSPRSERQHPNDRIVAVKPYGK